MPSFAQLPSAHTAARAHALAFGLLALAVVVVPAAPVKAQTSQGVVTTEEFEAKAAERARRAPAPLTIPEFAAADGADARAPRFRLTAVRISGNRTLPREEIVNAYAKFLGRTVSQRDLGDICLAITALYRDKGYALSRAFVPPQDITGGQVEIKVLEGFIEETRLEGLGPEWTLAHETLARVKDERPSRLATLERAMLLISDLPGVRIEDAKITEIGSGTGRFRLALKTNFARVGAYVEVDNRGSRDVGPWQNFTSVWFNSVARHGDSLLLNGSTIPNSPRQLAYIAAIYDTPLAGPSLRGGFRASYSEGWPDGWQGVWDTRTHMQDYAIFMSYAAVRTREASLRLTSSFGLRNADDSDNIGTNYTDRVRVFSISADAQLNDRLRGANFVNVTARQGLAALGASERGDADSSRPSAPADFTRLSVVASRYQALFGPVSLYLAAAGQLSTAPLHKSESIFFGGFQFGRAFAPGAIYGDSGLAGILEVRFDQNLGREFAKGYQLYGFIDRGVIWSRGYDAQTLSSAGGGLRLFLNDDLRASFEVATPIDTGGIFEPETRFYVSLARAFRGCARGFCDAAP